MDETAAKIEKSETLNVGYHMTGLPLHDESSAIEALSTIGYKTIALVPRRTSLHCEHPAFHDLLSVLRRQLMDVDMQAIIALDGCFVADANCRDWPSLSSEDPGEADQAEEMTRQWIQIAAKLESELVTFSSGMVPPPATGDQPDNGRWDRLGDRVNRLIDFGDQNGVSIALRLKPGHVVATIAQFETLLQWIRVPKRLHLAADVHAMIQGGEFPMADRLLRHLDAIRCIFIESMHLTDQSGGSSFAFDPSRLFQSLIEAGYREPIIIQTLRDQASPDGMPGLANAAWAWNAIGNTLGEQKAR